LTFFIMNQIGIKKPYKKMFKLKKKDI